MGYQFETTKAGLSAVSTDPDRQGFGCPKSAGSRYDDLPIATFGINTFCEELDEHGVDSESVLASAGIDVFDLENPSSQISCRQKVRLFRQIQRLDRSAGIGLRAGQRLRLQDLGIFGYALTSFPTFGQAIEFGVSHNRLAGCIVVRALHVRGDVAVIEGRDVFGLHDLLPLATEYAFSKIHRIATLVMERPFQTIKMRLPYAAPPHADLYSEIFKCDVEFGADAFEWTFDARQMSERCPNAARATELMCVALCDRMQEQLDSKEPAIVRAVRTECIRSTFGREPLSVSTIAKRLNRSQRTLTRRLAEAGVICQDIIDDARTRFAKEQLGNTSLSIDEIAERLGFFDASNFGKAFKRWTGETPAEYRRRVARREPFAARVSSSASSISLENVVDWKSRAHQVARG